MSEHSPRRSGISERPSRLTFALRQFDSDRIASLGFLFSDEAESDPWVLFHGTSGFNSEAIETQGFSSLHQPVSAEDIRRVIDLYGRTKWCGESGGGFIVLSPFSLDYDLRDERRSPLFFAETSLRALLYASRDFAGGEKLRALRIAFRDLDDYLADAHVRDRHSALMRAQFDALRRLDAPPSTIEAARPIEIDLDWLRHEVTGMADLRRTADEAWWRHDHGVVYALRMTTDDLADMCWNSFMGIEVTATISSARIVEKVVVPPDYAVDVFRDNGEHFLRRQNSGLLAALRGCTDR